MDARARLLPASAIAARDWARCMPGEAEGHAYYCACEASPPEGFALLAVAVYENSELIALCPVFRLEYHVATAIQGSMRALVEGLARWLPGLLRFSVIGLGSPLGERCHIGFDPGLDKPARRAALRLMLEALAEYAKAHRISMLAAKDLAEPDNVALAPALRAAGLARVNSLPVAVLDVPADEATYFASLSPATRKDLRRKLKQNASVRIERRDTIEGIETEIAALYAATRANSALDYGAFEDLPPEFFPRTLQALGPRAILMLYYVDTTLAAFNLLLRDDHRLIDKFWGVRRELARRHNLYYGSWMANLRLCLTEGIAMLQTGQTAYANKLRLGSRLVPSHVWFVHRNPLAHGVLRLLARFIAFDKMDPDLAALAKKVPRP